MKSTIALKKKATKDYGIFLNIEEIVKSREDKSKEELIAEVERLKAKYSQAMEKYKKDSSEKENELRLILAACVHSGSITKETAQKKLSDFGFSNPVPLPIEFFIHKFLMNAINDLFRLGLELEC